MYTIVLVNTQSCDSYFNCKCAWSEASATLCTSSFNHRVVTLVADKLETVLCVHSGYFKPLIAAGPSQMFSG